MASNGLVFVAEELFSRIARNKEGEKIVNGFEIDATSDFSDPEKILDKAVKTISDLGGFIISSVSSFIDFSWTGFWTYFTVARQFIWNFNWNSTDEELNANIKGQYAVLAGQLGLTLGQVFGYAACGFVPGITIFAFNEALGTQILTNVTEHFVEGFLQNLGILLQQTLVVGTQILLTETFKSVRKLIKSNSTAIAKFFGEKGLKNAIDGWGAANSKPWSFASATQELVDNTFGKEGIGAQFANQFLQQADQSCIEAGYVVASSTDSWISQQALANQVVSPLGNERYVEITPNRKIPDEKIILAGQEEMLKPLIVQTLTTNQQFNGRDLGVVYGELQGEIRERRYRPEVVLKFYRKQNKVASKGEIHDALSMQVSFRLMNKTVADFASNTYLKLLAEMIYEEFAGSPYQIHKGTQVYTYADFQHGYQLKLDVNNEGEALRVIRSALAITQTPFNENHFRIGSKPVEPLTSPQTIELQGHEVTLPLNNKTGIVTFTHAYLNVGVNVPPINLVDVTGRKKNVVFKPTK